MMRKTTAKKILNSTSLKTRWTKPLIARLVKACAALKSLDLDIISVEQLSTKWCDPVHANPEKSRRAQQFKCYRVWILSNASPLSSNRKVAKFVTIERNGSFDLR